ncbi:hypothetical protein QAD02_007003 [Eretmocerus hayati]|uniref:Uncharacterized protein n=1 Tax=Eretmocerus hayati TaxID=131215 RepID=A0ACC2N377_9HYME|nr:hypothetical protein QAD02_007003 [Eretmocerus hayati]
MDINGNQIESEEEFDGPDPITPRQDDSRNRSPIPDQQFPDNQHLDDHERYNVENGFIAEGEPLVNEEYGDDEMFDERIDPIQILSKMAGESIFHRDGLPLHYESEINQSHLPSHYPQIGAFTIPQTNRPESVTSDECFNDEDDLSEQLQTTENREEPASPNDDSAALENNDRAEQGDLTRPVEDAKAEEPDGNFERIGDTVSDLGAAPQEGILSDAQPKRTMSETMMVDDDLPSPGLSESHTDGKIGGTSQQQQQQSMECPDRLPSELPLSANDMGPDGVINRPVASNGKRKSKNPFIVFFLSMYSRRPKKKVTDVARQAGRQWRRMTDRQRSRYIAMVAASKPIPVTVDKVKADSEKRVATRRTRKDNRSS